MSLSLSVKEARHDRFPRVSGDEPQFSVYRYGAVAFSPRERG